jgi:1,4-alpha-glucan branching enzyme
MNEMALKKLTAAMKHNHNHDNGPIISDLLPVRFEFIHLTAKNVSVAGTFNDWKPEAKTLHASEAGKWFKETTLRPGVYEYCFVVDGQWLPDPTAAETVSNPFGGQNSILKVGHGAEESRQPESQNLADKSKLANRSKSLR